jgi:hypothetical protein
MTDNVTKALREEIAAEAGYRCGYCLTDQRVSGVPARRFWVVAGWHPSFF